MKKPIGCTRRFVFLFTFCYLLTGMTHAKKPQPPFETDVTTEVTFQTTDKAMQTLYDAAMSKMKGNIVALID